MSRPATCCFLLLLLLPAAAWGQGLESVAIAGEPFGIARVRIPAPALATLEPDLVVTVRDADHRALYPASRQLQIPARPGERLRRADELSVGGGRLLARIGQLIESAASPPGRETVGYEAYFLFSGDAPLDVELHGPASVRVNLVPQAASPRARQALLLAWWEAFQNDLQGRVERGDYPALVETYLIASLRRRLGLPPEGVARPADDEPPGPLSTLKLLTGAEELRIETFRRLAGGTPDEVPDARLAVPPSPELAPPPVPPVDSEAVAVEETALRIPPESFYIRFGSFTNYLWFRQLSSEHGGDIAQMISLRGINYDTSARAERMLNLRSTELTRLLGPQVIEDVALVGSDLFLTGGAAIGVLLKARNPFLLTTSLDADRRATADRVPGARLSTERIAGRDVSLLSSPDYRVRSFWVQDGPWQLLTTSREVARRFIEVAAGAPSLGQTDEFRYARSLMPLQSEHTLFAYFSSAFFQNLVGPQYQIELRRRMEAGAAIDLVRLAQAAAAAEGQSLRQVDRLVAAGYLPPAAGKRPDGTGPVVAGDQIVDSLRGASGSFLPIPDVPLEAVTPREAERYRRLASFYATDWRQMDPVLVALERTPLEAGRERIDLHVEVAPLVPEKYGWITEQLGPPTRRAIRFAPDDIAHIQAHVVPRALGGSIPPHHLFAAVKDSVPPHPDALQGVLRGYLALQTVPGYLGAWPEPGVLDRLPLGLGRGRPVGPGMNRLVGGVYRTQRDGFSVVSFQPNVLAASTPYLAVLESDAPAQVRLRVDDLTGSRLEGWANGLLYERAYGASLAGARMLDAITRQLRVDSEEAPEVAARLLGGRLQCPLGGQYVLEPAGPAGEPRQWRSTAWPNHPATDQPPPDYQAPLLAWFRGISANLTQYPNRLVVRATLQRQVNGGQVTPAESEEVPTPEAIEKPEGAK